MLNAINKIINYVRGFQNLSKQSISINIDQYLLANLKNSQRYTDKHLQQYEFQTFSQNGEDGIVSEIFRRIGTTNEYFVEFGVESGIENNTANLLRKGWSGLWIEGSKRFYDRITKTHAQPIESKRLVVVNAMINAENIENLLAAANVPRNIDLLSIDVDGNDWYIWRSIVNYNPRAVIVEYNSHFDANDDMIIGYDKSHLWDGTFYFGASLTAFDKLARQKGYSLVGCDFTGTNAFFVRSELVGDLFQEPFTPEFHYEPCRFFLGRRIGHKQRWGHFTSADEQLRNE